MKTINYADFLVQKGIISAVMRVEFVTEKMLYITLRGRWCDIIVLNIHAPTEYKIDDMKGSFYVELERVFDKFPKYHMKILLGNFSAKIGKKCILKQTTGNESLHEINNVNEVRIATFATSNNLTVKSTMFPHTYLHTELSPS
jgi:hypothetical protein